MLSALLKHPKIHSSYSSTLLTNDVPLGLVAQQIDKQKSNKHFILQIPKCGLAIIHTVLLSQKLAHIKGPLYRRGCWGFFWGFFFNGKPFIKEAGQTLKQYFPRVKSTRLWDEHSRIKCLSPTAPQFLSIQLRFLSRFKGILHRSY